MKIRQFYLKAKASKYGSLIDFSLFSLITIFLHFFYYNYLSFLFHTTFFHETTNFMASQVFRGAMWVNLHIMPFDIRTDYLTNTLYINGNDYITVSEGCSGFKQDYQLLGLFILYPGIIRHKLWFIPFTFVVMHFTNIFRIVLLTAILNYIPQQWDFWHEWVMRPFYYVVIFMLWVWWNEKFTRSSQQLAVSS